MVDRFDGSPEMQSYKNGDYVRYSDYAALEARAEAAERALSERAGGVKVPIGYALVPVEPTDRMVSAYVAAKPKGAGFNHPRKGDDKKAWFAAHEKKCRERWKAMLSVSTLTTEPAASDSAETMLSNLLARIHRDGGHYEAMNGTEKAVADADNIIARIYASQPAAPEGRREAVRIGDAVLDWMVKFDLLDAGNEYYVSDVLAVLNDLTPSTRPAEQAVTEAKPVAFRVHDFHVARIPMKARGKFDEPTEYFYPASRENDARETARIMGATCTPLYAGKESE